MMSSHNKVARCTKADRIAAPSANLFTELVYEGDPEGSPVVHHRVVDTLGQMLRSGTIDHAMHDAARDFQAAFTLSNLDSLRAAPLVRISAASRPGDLTDGQIGARRRVHSAIESVGGLASPGGSVVWHVVGLGSSVREWALRQGWGGRSVHHQQAYGVLIAALGMLASHYGYSPSKPPPHDFVDAPARKGLDPRKHKG